MDTPLTGYRCFKRKAGIPAEEVDASFEEGLLKDRVGTSYLEKEYESVLQGERAIKEIHLTRTGIWKVSTHF